MAIQSRSLMQLTQGATPQQAHRNLTPGHKEEELTRQGFGGRSTVFYRHGDPTSYHPFDVYGWKGDLFPFAFNIEDWNVLMSDSLHIPPTMAVFMCSETDYDEVHLMHGGRKQGTSLQTGRIDHDPQGINHGVSEDDRQTSRNEWDSVDYTDWSVIMIEAKNPVRLDPDVPADIVA